MKRGIVTMFLAGLIASPVLAVPTALIDRDGAFWNATLGGGQFRVTPNADLMAISGETGSFLTFCVEEQESLVMPGPFYASVMPDAVVGGYDSDGFIGPNGGDLLDTRSAYLYRQYRNGTITISSNVEAGVFQQAIWVIEDEIAPLPNNHPAMLLVADAEANANGSTYGIQVLHLWQGEPGWKPDQVQDLLIDASGPCTIPAPGALVLGSLGLAVIRCCRRHRDS